MLSVEELNDSVNNPLDTLEILISQNEWPYERMGNEEIVAAIASEWCDFHMRYIWLNDKGILQLAGQLDVRIQDNKRTSVLELITQINERLDLGFFAVWSYDETIMFRHSIHFPSGGVDMVSVCELATRSIIKEINRYFPVFQFVIWAGKSPSDAIEAAMLETVGNA